MYAVIRTGGKQYRVAPGDVVKIERPAGESASEVEFDDVLAFSDGVSPLVKPTGAKVLGTVVSEGRGDKVNTRNCRVIARLSPRSGSAASRSTASAMAKKRPRQRDRQWHIKKA
jgi:ribosomal protein L21